MANQHSSWPQEHQDYLAAYVKQKGKTWKDATVELNDVFGTNYSYNAVKIKGIRMGLRQTSETEKLPAPEAQLWIVESEPGQRVKTLDDLLATTHVDLDVWEVDRYVVNKWDSASTDINKEAQVVELYQVKVWLRRKHPFAHVLGELGEALLSDIKALPKEYKVPPKRNAPHLAERVMYEFCPFDLHLGKLCHGDETVTDYNLEIAGDLFATACEDLMEKAAGFHAGQWVMVVGNDVSHIDNLLNGTTAGTRMDNSDRYIQVFRYARKIHSWAVNRLIEEIGPGKVITVRGNHDNQLSFHLGELLAAEFDLSPHVAFDNSAHLRKYHRHGVNLIGYTHGSEERPSDLPLLMAREVPELWSKAKLYEWHIGHLHKMKETHFTAGDSFAGVRVRILPTLTAHDAWHYSKGYTDRRACEAYLWHSETGYIGHLSSNVDHFTGEPLCSQPS